MMAYLDKETGLWKWGRNGIPKYNSKRECETEGLRILCEKLTYIRDHVSKAVHNHGKP